ncbi:MAG: GGDEF domain-containing protein, partial [Clostridiales bacterium]|nr:GGDEF domain-containing protein [Clostridiales bacterium]
YNNIVYGILEAGDFLFPQYISRYISLALGISRVCGLVISNARQYEMLEKAKDDVTYISYHDSLTGLYNRNYFINCMQNHSVTPTTVVFACDIDGLKAVNDKLGHNAGNELIKMAATVLKESFRETDTVTRIGGDEFAILVFDGGKDFAALAKKRIEDAVNKVNTRKNPPPFKLSISTGYSCAESEKMHELLNAASNQESEWDMLIKSADNEMYLEKAFKKNIKT